MADPVASGNAAANATYSGAQARTETAKKALLAELANTAAAGGAVNSAIQSDATALQPRVSKYADPSSGQALSGVQTALGQESNAYQQLAALSQQSAGNYFTGVQQALPLEQSRAASAAAQIYADIQAKKEQQAQEREMAQLALQKQREEIAYEREQRASGGTLTDPKDRLSFQAAAEDRAYEPVISGYVNADGTMSRRGKAIEAIVNGADPKTAFAQAGLRTKAYQQEVLDAVSRYHSALNQLGYYKALGLQVPGPMQLAVSGQDVLAGIDALHPVAKTHPALRERSDESLGAKVNRWLGLSGWHF